MAVIDRRNATVSANAGPAATSPNAGLAIKTAVRGATTAAIDLQTTGLSAIDGITPIAGERWLVKNQSDPTENGIYQASSGVWQRAPDAANNSQFARGMMVRVLDGATNAGAMHELTSADPVIGTSALNFVEVGVGEGSTRTYRTRAYAQSIAIPVNAVAIVTLGDTEPGDGGGDGWRAVASAPAHGCYFTDAGGRHWEYAPQHGFINPLAHGATRDNATDCSPIMEKMWAFQALRPVAALKNGAWPIRFPQGQFAFLRPLAPSNVPIFVEGGHHGTGPGGAGFSGDYATQFVLHYTTGSLFTIDSYIPSTFRGIQFQVMPGNRPQTDGATIDLTSTVATASGTVIEHCSFGSCGIAIRAHRPHRLTVRSCFFLGWNQAAIWFDTVDLVEGGGGWISDSDFWGDVDDGQGPAIYTEVGYTKIFDCGFLAARYGVHFNVKTFPAGGLEIFECYFEEQNRAGVYAQSADGSAARLLAINNCEFNKTGTDAAFYQGGIIIGDYNDGTQWLDTVQVHGNRMCGYLPATARYIWVMTGTNGSVYNNTITDLGNDAPVGIQITGVSSNDGIAAPFHVAGNTLSGIFSGIHIQAASNVLVEHLQGVAVANLPNVGAEGSRWYASDGVPGSTPLRGGGTGCTAMIFGTGWVGLGATSAPSAGTDAVTKAYADARETAAKAYADGLVVGLWDDRGSYNASGNVYPSSGGSGSAGAILKGDIWTISTGGTLGGVAVGVGDTVRALTDAPGQTAANWSVLENNIGYVPEDVANKSTSTALGTSNTLYPTQNAVKSYVDTGLAAKVTGPTSVTDNRFALFDGTTGKLVKQASGAPGDAAFKNTGTSAGTLAAGDDARITGAIQGSLLTTRGDLIRRGASAPERVALGAAGAILGSNGTDAVWVPPGWTAWTPTISTSSGAFGSVTAVASYKEVNGIVFFQLVITVANGGTATDIRFTLPSTPAVDNINCNGRDTTVSGAALHGFIITGDMVQVVTYVNGAAGATGQVLKLSGFYVK